MRIQAPTTFQKRGLFDSREPSRQNSRKQTSGLMRSTLVKSKTRNWEISTMWRSLTFGSLNRRFQNLSAGFSMKFWIAILVFQPGLVAFYRRRKWIAHKSQTDIRLRNWEDDTLIVVKIWANWWIASMKWRKRDWIYWSRIYIRRMSLILGTPLMYPSLRIHDQMISWKYSSACHL